MAANHPDIALVPFIRGELAAIERERVAGHLEGCLQCRQEAESLQSLLAELSARIDELPTPDWTVYRAQLRRKLAARTQSRTRWWSGREWWSGSVGWASLAAATAAVVIAVWFAVPGLHPGTSSPMMPSNDQIALVQQLGVTDVGLLRNYGVVERLDLLENYDVIEHLDELKPVSQPGNAVRS
jgi:anti-sigma factor RsiW